MLPVVIMSSHFHLYIGCLSNSLSILLKLLRVDLFILLCKSNAVELDVSKVIHICSGNGILKCI